MPADDVQTNLRLPADLKERLVVSAVANNRSLSAEVASRLEDSYKVTSSEALRHYVRSIQIEMAGMHAELAVFTAEARSVAQMLLGLCRDLERADGPTPPFLQTAKTLAESIIQSADRHGKDPVATVEEMKAKAERIANEETLFPHTFSERSIFELAEERWRGLGLAPKAPEP